MFEDKKIKILETQNKKLIKENSSLNNKVKELELQIKNMEAVVEAADKYREAHQERMFALGEAKQKYEIAYKQMTKLKKEYQIKMDAILNNIS